MRGDRFRENPPLGAPWLTPQIEARLRDLERREIKRLTAKWDAEEGILCCREMSAHALEIAEAASGQKGMIYSGIVLYPRDPGGWPNADWCQLDGAYHHYWVILDDGTIVDAATTQFGERCPLVIPLGHPLQRRYVPEHPTEEEFESGAVPLDLERWKKSFRRNPGAYYHGSKTPLEIGTILRPKADGYVQQQYADGSEDNWVELELEKARPKDKLSRLESVFMLDLDPGREDDDGFLFDSAGGYGDYVYEVEPLGRVEQSDLRWYTYAAFLAKTPLSKKRAINAYWRGKRAGYLMEARTPAARVVRRAGGHEGKG